MQAFSVLQRRREKVGTGNERACGTQRRAAGVPQAIRNVLPALADLRKNASPQVLAVCRRNCGAVRCVALRNT